MKLSTFEFKAQNMYHILFYKTSHDYMERRGEFRAEHLALAEKAQKDGTIVLAGALADPPDQAVLIFKGEDSAAVAEEFAKNDPYVKNGIVVEWKVRPWTVVIGNNP